MIRLTKRAFEAAGISMPDEAREVVFPKGVPVRSLEDDQLPPDKDRRRDQRADEEATHNAEGDLTSEADEIQQQARESRTPEGGANLLEEGR